MVSLCGLQGHGQNGGYLCFKKGLPLTQSFRGAQGPGNPLRNTLLKNGVPPPRIYIVVMLYLVQQQYFFVQRDQGLWEHVGSR